MSARVQVMDDPEVGRGQGEFFQPSSQKQRVALVPAAISSAQLEPSEELNARAQKGDAGAIEDLQALAKKKEILERGVEKDPPSVIKLPEPEETYLFARADSCFTHYLQGVGYFFCKKAEYEAAGRQPTCCNHSERDALLRYALVLLVYDTDPEGQLIKIPQERALPLDDKNRLDFKYKFCTWALTDSQMRVWKTFHAQNPPISTDYEVWTEKQGNSERVKFAPCRGDAKWMTKGPVLMKKVLREGAKIWEGIQRTLGKDLGTDDIDTMFLGNQGKKAATSEKDFKGLLGS